MPLTYDDIPGSWGDYSTGWPCINFPTKDAADRGYVACTKEWIVPYGSYVLVGNSLRLESEDYKNKLTKHLAATTLTTAQVLEKYNV